MEDEEPCGKTFEIDLHDLAGGATLTCSRPLNHTPSNIHSDGVTDWTDDEC